MEKRKVIKKSPEGILMTKGSSLVKEKFVKCPKCNVRMDKKTNGKFIIDACPSCKGIFLDKVEIDNIANQGFFNYVLAYFKRPKKIER